MSNRITTRVVSLKRRPDRRDAMSERLRSEGIAWTWLDATDGQEVAHSELARKFADMSKSYPPMPAEMACAISHYRCWEAFLESDANALCVLEDDVQFSPALSKLLEDDAWVTPAHGLIKLDRNSRKAKKILVSETDLSSPVAGAKLYRLWSRSLGAGGYIAHREVIAELLQGCSKFRVAIDHHLFNPVYAPHFRTFGVYRFSPVTIFHDHTGSDIEQARRGQREGGEWRRIKRTRSLENALAIPGRIWAIIYKKARFRDLP